jgi:hypothetical protein
VAEVETAAQQDRAWVAAAIVVVGDRQAASRSVLCMVL